MLSSELAARIEAEVTALAGRTRQAAELQELMARKALPQASPYAYVVPLGLIPRGQGDAGTGYFTQMVDEAFAVFIFVRASGDLTGARGLPTIDELIWALIDAICGWAPENAIGVFQLRRGRIHSVSAGGIFYQLDFAIQLQVRVLQ